MKDYMTTTTTFPPKILEKDCETCISIYMPTHRTAPDNRQDSIMFKNIVSELDDMGDYSKQVKKLKELEEDTEFWVYNLDGLVILMNEDDMEIYRLPRTVEKYLSVGERYYIKPLLRNYQSDHRYHALGLARDSFKLFSGNRYGFREIEIDEEDRLLENVLGDVLEGGELNVVSHGGSVGNFHGHSARSEEIKVDTKRFFQYTDKFILDNYSRKEKIPLILISLPEHQSQFRELSNNEYLLDKGIDKSYESIDQYELTEVLWKALEPVYNEKTQSLINQYQVGINEDTATNTIQTTLERLMEDRIRTLVIEADKSILGEIHEENVSYDLDDNGHDILNHLAQIALKKNVEVIILPKEKMPDNLSVFSLLHY